MNNTRVKEVLIDLDYTKHLQHHRDKLGIAYPQGLTGFYRSIPPLPGAVLVMEALKRDSRYEPFFCTSPPRSPLSLHCLTEKAQCVIDRFGEWWFPRMILTMRKDGERGDILIDNMHNTHGQSDFNGEFWHFGQAGCEDWVVAARRLDLDIPEFESAPL